MERKSWNAFEGCLDHEGLIDHELLRNYQLKIMLEI